MEQVDTGSSRAPLFSGGLAARTRAADRRSSTGRRGVLGLRTRPGHRRNPHHPGGPRVPRRPPRPAPGGRPAAGHAPDHAGPAGLRQLRPPSRAAGHSVDRLRPVHQRRSWRRWDWARTRSCWGIRSARSSPAISWRPTPGRRRADPGQSHRRARPGGPQGRDDQARRALLPRPPHASPAGSGWPCCAARLIVRVMSVAMAKTGDKDLRRFIHAQHSAYFYAFADRDSLLQAFKASVGSNVSEVAGELTLPVLLIAGEKDEIATAGGPAQTRRAAAGRGAGGHSRRRAPDPLRNPRARRPASSDAS